MTITRLEAGLSPDYHPTCGPNRDMKLFVDPDGADPLNDSMARDLDDVVLWAYGGLARNRQQMVGPSELGDSCDRKLAYRLVGAPTVNTRTDPWPAIVGTSVHSWLETAFSGLQVEVNRTRWLTETEVVVDDLVLGHCDLYDLETGCVWDFKTVNSQRLSKFRQEGPPESYRTQVHLYGMGMVRAGYPVRRVGLIMLPRAGWLSGKWLWSQPYDESIALAALSRMYHLAEQLVRLNADQDLGRVMEVPPTPSQLCSFCRFYTPDPGPSNGYGCPGK